MELFDVLDILDIPFSFIKDNLNGWCILFIICIIIYFIVLRTYYIKKEQFRDNVMIDDTDNTYNTDNTVLSPNNTTYISNNINKKDHTKSYKHNRAKKNKNIKNIVISDNSDNSDSIIDNSIIVNSNNSDNYEKDYDNILNNKNNKDNKENEVYTKLRGTHVFEGFETISTPQTTKAPETNNTQNIIFETTLFDNLNLSLEQVKLCKQYYYKIITTYITELEKLIKLYKNNAYLNTKKQFNIIINNGIDNIINYLSNTIKSINTLTRTSIKTDVINKLSNYLENIIDNTNNDLSNNMNKLARLNSTTIDYKSMLKDIDVSRAKLDTYIEIDKLVSNNGKNISNYNSNINKVLDKSFILPIYERNFDKINQLIKSDYNDNETILSSKYGTAYTNYLNEKKKTELDINPLRLASKIESGIVNMLTSLVDRKGNDGNDGNDDNDGNVSSRYMNNGDIIEQNTSIRGNASNLNPNANIYNDRGNIGNYLIDKNTKKQMLEGFENKVEDIDNTNTTIPSTTNTTIPSTTKYTEKEDDEKNTNNDINILSKLLSGDFIKYIMDYINDKLSIIYGMYGSKFGYGNKNNDKNGYSSNFNIEENMIPAGFLLFILSMLIYFIDSTS